VIPRGVRFIDGSAFRWAALSSISIESGNERFVVAQCLLIDIVDHKLIQNFSNLRFVIIPSEIEILRSSCFRRTESLSTVSFELATRLGRIESGVFPLLSGRVALSSTVLFVAHDASEILDHLRLCDEDSYPEFDRWQLVQGSKIAVDFRRIERGKATQVLDLTGFEVGSVICDW
jgi:hypothetical protein